MSTSLCAHVPAGITVDWHANLCACGERLVTCSKCGDERCLSCDPYEEDDDCA